MKSTSTRTSEARAILKTFGCTKIGLLIDPAELDLPAVDTAVAHCQAAVEFAPA